MSFSATRWAWQQRGLSPAQRCTLLSLADRAGEDNTCYPSLQRIAFDTEQDIKTVRKALNILCEKGLIIRRERSGESCTYQLVGVEVWKSSAEVPPTNVGTPTNSGTTTTIAVYPYQFGADPLPSTRVSQEKSIEPLFNLNSPLPPAGGACLEGEGGISLPAWQKKNTSDLTERDAFAKCFAAYPVKQAQEEAWRVWKNLKNSNSLPDLQEILQAIQAHMSADSRWKRGKIPLMKNWLLSKRWRDQPYVEGEAPKMLHDSPVQPHSTANSMPSLMAVWKEEAANRTLSLPTDVLAALRGDTEAKKRIDRLRRISA